MDLFLRAAANGPILDANFAELLQVREREAQAILQFADTVERDGRVAVNFRLSTLHGFLATGQYEDIHRWALRVSVRSSKRAEEIVREKLGPWFDRRLMLEAHFDNGRDFNYAALNIGGVGATNYGDLCALTRGDTVSAWKTACFRGDSLAAYTSGQTGIDLDRLCNEAGPLSHRRQLASLKHAEQVASTPASNWPAMVCCASQYIEIVFLGALAPKDIEAIRMPSARHKELFDWAYEEFDTPSSDERRCTIEMFRQVLDKLDTLGISLERVES